MIAPTKFNDDAETPEYFLCQYMPDVLRKEPRNIGIVVRCGDSVECRFIGESGNEIDGRGLSWIRDLGAYKEWVRFWKKTANGDRESMETMLLTSGKRNYFVVPGGHVGEIGAASDLSSICSLLFSTLVSGGIDQFIKEYEGIQDAPRFELKRDVTSAFRKAGVFGSNARVHAPVLEDQPLLGERGIHRFCYGQFSNSTTRVMEVINIARGNSESIGYHAGWAAMAFNDVAKVKHDTRIDAVSIVIFATPGTRDELNEYCMNLLSSSSRIVEWNVDESRESLVGDCKKSAGLVF